ncbi:MAG TPA: serine hydrolase [Vicinamibacterales bacterium]|jgi:CubicO group peptidase (beta-lactamase class C family)
MSIKPVLRAVVLVFVATAAFAQDTARMDAVVQSYVSNKTFMGAVLVARGGDVILSKGYGFANLEWDIPNTPATKFRLGSLTKQFTSTSILLLEERGKLKIEDPVRTYLPDAPETWDRITLFNLLTHTSGIPNYTNLPEFKTLQAAETTPEKTIALVRDKPLDFAPGEKMLYSNTGYVVLGAVIEKVSGVSYEKFVQDNIFTPLAMKDSGYDSNSAVIKRRAAGYAPSSSGFLNAPYIDMTVPYAAGALYSTTEDLLRWEQALFGGKLLSAASLKKMTTPFKGDYALGVTVTKADGRTVVAHNGGINGFNTFLAYYPDDKLTVAVLANVNGTAPTDIASKLGTIAHGGTVVTQSERKEIAVPAATLQKNVGTYQLAPGMKMWIRLQDDHLTAQLSGQPQFPIFAESDQKFFFKIVDAQLDFVRDPGGEVTAAVLHQAGRDITAPRTSGAIVDVPQHTEITLPTTTLSKYTGTYRLRPNVDLTITLDGTQLIAQVGAQQKLPIFPETETKFFYKVVEATLDFQSDATGAITGVRFRQGPADEILPRK